MTDRPGGRPGTDDRTHYCHTCSEYLAVEETESPTLRCGRYIELLEAGFGRRAPMNESAT